VAAVEILYGADMRDASPLDVLAEREDADGYCRHLVENVHERRAELDRVLGEHSHTWPIARMSPVDLNVLRVGALELTEGDVPVAAVIDEAVEIAKRFSGEDAGRFVNGVLEAVRQSVSAGGSGEGDGGGGGTSGGGGAGGEGGSSSG
jgi:N utilization substance protein B